MAESAACGGGPAESRGGFFLTFVLVSNAVIVVDLPIGIAIFKAAGASSGAQFRIEKMSMMSATIDGAISAPASRIIETIKPYGVKCNILPLLASI